MKNFFKIQESKDEGYTAFLKEKYNEADKFYDNRDKNAKDYEKLLNEIKEEQQRHRNEEKVLFHLVRGNIYLRMGQEKDRNVEDSRKEYVEAEKALERAWKENNRTETKDRQLGLLILLNIGKYFRNVRSLGKSGDLEIAIRQFKKIEKDTEENSEAEKEDWEIHLRLDAKMSRGRVEEKRHHLEEAEKIYNEFIEAEEKTGTGSSKFTEEYRIQAMVRKGIVYRKKRDYEKAKELFEKVLEKQKENEDAKNNLAVCEYKIEKLGNNGENPKETKHFSSLEKTGVSKSRFYKITVLKQKIENQKENTEKFTEELKNELQEMLKNNPKDKELQMLQAHYFQRTKSWEEALEMYKKIYEKEPFIEEGGIGLKAYFNMARCLICQKKFFKAKEILTDILKRRKEDLLAKIDLGWCFMCMGDFERAKKEYEELIEMENFEKLYHTQKMMAWNNLSECRLKTGDVMNAESRCDETLKEEANNGKALYIKAYCQKVKSERQEIEALEEMAKKLEEAERADYQEEYTVSDLAAVRCQICKAKNLKKEPYETWKEAVKNQLFLFPETDYSLKTCFYLTELIELLPEEEKKDWYQALSRIHFIEKEEGSVAFRHLRDRKEFLELKPLFRGKVMGELFKIFDHVAAIKETSRVTAVEETEKDQVAIKKIPAHYTRLETLKIFLGKSEKDEKKEPKLRLWNTAYMNDPFEGERFMEMMRSVWTAGKGKDADHILKNYFPYLKNRRENETGEEGLAPINGNVYITSFSEEQDGIQMWSNYTDKGRGFSLVFEEDFFDIHKKSRNWNNGSVYSDTDYPLYKVQYLTMEQFKKNEGDSSLKDIKESMKKIWESLDKIEELIKEMGEEEIEKENKEVIYEFVADMLNEVRFLFKDPEYEHERELRLIRHSYEPQMEAKAFTIPRLYIEVEKELKFKEIRLGPGYSQSETNELVSWLSAEKQVKKIVKSERHYR